MSRRSLQNTWAISRNHCDLRRYRYPWVWHSRPETFQSFPTQPNRSITVRLWQSYNLRQHGSDLTFSFAVSQLAHFCASAGSAQWAALHHLMEYLAAHPSFKIKYRRGTTLIDLLSRYADADWGNNSSRRSMSGMVMLYNIPDHVEVEDAGDHGALDSGGRVLLSIGGWMRFCTAGLFWTSI